MCSFLFLFYFSGEKQSQDAQALMTMDAIAASQVYFVGEVALPFFETITGLFSALRSVVYFQNKLTKTKFVNQKCVL